MNTRAATRYDLGWQRYLGCPLLNDVPKPLGERLSLDVLKAAKIGAFSGIASPESFEKMLRDFGAEILYNQRFLDHHRFTRYEIERLYRKAGKANLDMIVTTEKDAVRLFDNVKASVPVYYLRLEIDILSGEEDFEGATERICRPRR